MMDQEFLLMLVALVMVVQALLNVLLAFWNNRSAPLGEVRELIRELRPLVLKTDTRLDDLLLDTADNMVDVLDGDDGVSEDEVLQPAA